MVVGWEFCEAKIGERHAVFLEFCVSDVHDVSYRRGAKANIDHLPGAAFGTSYASV